MEKKKEPSSPADIKRTAEKIEADKRKFDNKLDFCSIKISLKELSISAPCDCMPLICLMLVILIVGTLVISIILTQPAVLSQLVLLATSL